MQGLAEARQKLEAGNALEAALKAEEFFAAAPLCLDAQVLIWKALSAMGPQFGEAAQGVREESARLLARLPGLEKLSFSDGSPFASPQTVLWLQADPNPLRPGGEEPGAARDPFPERMREARALLEQSKLSEALDLLDAAKTHSPSENLRCRIAQLRLLCEAGKGEVGLALAEALLAETTAHDLDNWDPSLALDALAAIGDALTLFEAQNTQTRREVTGRIARLHPSSALG
jgi:type VI secretion system protein VasJ